MKNLSQIGELLKMTISETILGGMVLSFISATLGVVVGSWNKVSTKACDGKRQGCTALFNEKLDNILKEVRELKKIVDGKLLGL